MARACGPGLRSKVQNHCHPVPSLCGEAGSQVKRSQAHPTPVRPHRLDTAFLHWHSALAQRPPPDMSSHLASLGISPQRPPAGWARPPWGLQAQQPRELRADSSCCWPGWLGWTGHTLLPGLPGLSSSAPGPHAPGDGHTAHRAQVQGHSQRACLCGGLSSFSRGDTHRKSSASYGRSTVYNSILQSCY